ncbi:SDR family NAD(P)-dependent oxidoreductase [Nocardia jiangxiensis]|uniref:SDR family NAD(P)-dependent oxidoreductase n=1 Tax=Nocardia jiangxiensis TaxID=282685 RepID=A0ABW6S0S1_9NOCA
MAEIPDLPTHSSDGELTDRVAVITGAGSGIGRASALALAASGARVICADLDAAAAEAAAVAAGVGASAGCVDVTDSRAVHRLVGSVLERYGRLDIYANIAGAVTSRGPVSAVTEEEFDRGLALNLKSLVFGCQAAAAAMTSGGSIINVGSGTVDAAVGELAAYSIPKAGVLQLTRSLAREMGPAGIRVNTVSPGYILTGMTDINFQDEHGAIDDEKRQRIIDDQSSSIPLGRPGQPGEVASVVRFLAGDGASYVTGQVIRVNGGSVMPL